MKNFKFEKKSQYGEKGEERKVTDRAAEMFEKLGLGTYEKEEKSEYETKELKGKVKK